MSNESVGIAYQFYNVHGGGYWSRFLQRNPEFKTKDFEEYVIGRNRGDRDSGELNDIAKHEVLRLAAEFCESRFRFPNVHGRAEE